MRFVVYCVSFCALLSFFTSCQPEPDDTLPTPPRLEVNDSISIKMIVSIDTSFASGIDTADKLVFHYDALNRLVLIDFYEYEAGEPGVIYHNTEQHFYNGNDTLPYKMSGKIDMAPGPPYLHTVFYRYQNAVIVYDSVITTSSGGFTSAQVRTFKWHGNGKISQNLYSVYPDSLHLTDSLVSVQTYQNGNLVLQFDTSLMASHGITQKSVYEYDNNINPLRRLNLPYPIVTDAGYTSTWSFIQEVMSANNQTKDYRILEEWDLFSDYTTHYTYRSDGYPVLARHNTTDFKYKVFYYYQK